MKYVIGIDEVGRGSLAGPVTVCALLWPQGQVFRNTPRVKLNDSKKLSKRQREDWSHYLKAHSAVHMELASVSNKVIDKINIAQATNLAATRALGKIIANKNLKKSDIFIYLDGGLKLKKFNNFKIQTVIGGDAKIKVIMAASIVAKVYRDRFMTNLDAKYPLYGFRENKGYGTEKHTKTIKLNGPSIHHRLTFLRKITIL